MSWRLATSAFAVLVVGALPASAAAQPSAVLQYSAEVPTVASGGPEAGAPTVARSVFRGVPERDVYALALVAISPELGGSVGIGGVTAPPDPGAGGTYESEQSTVAEAILNGLGDGLLIGMLAAALAALAAAGALGEHRERPPPRSVP